MAPLVFCFATALQDSSKVAMPPAQIEQQATTDSQGLLNAPKIGDKVAILDTEKGKVIVMFLPEKAPKHVANFIDLADKKFYDGTRFHRCIAGFMVQGGDPNSKDLNKFGRWGTGGYYENDSERTVPAEFNKVKHLRGIVSMARSSDPNSASSQFFIMVADYPSLDGQYSAFGKVVSGMSAVDEIVKTGDSNNNGQVDPSAAVMLKSVTIKTWPLPKE
ncbi:MAG: peptidylprolyl isomerase [Armatimonadota bacterium]